MCCPGNGTLTTVGLMSVVQILVATLATQSSSQTRHPSVHEPDGPHLGPSMLTSPHAIHLIPSLSPSCSSLLIQHTDPFFIVRIVPLFRCQYEEYAPSLFLSHVRSRLLTLVFHRPRRPTTILPCHFLNPSFLWSRTIHRHHPSISTS